MRIIILQTALSVTVGTANYVILTFDDGYKSQYTIAKPILDKYGFKGTFYVVCNYAQKIDTDRMNWTEMKKHYINKDTT